jgi:hypothetical protein
VLYRAWSVSEVLHRARSVFVNRRVYCEQGRSPNVFYRARSVTCMIIVMTCYVDDAVGWCDYVCMRRLRVYVCQVIEVLIPLVCNVPVVDSPR